MKLTMYPLEVAADEDAAGFHRMDIERLNLKLGRKDRVPAVLCPFGKSFRVVKCWIPARPDARDANRIVEALTQWIALGNNKNYPPRDPQLLDVEP
jgi:hypothetical protein